MVKHVILWQLKDSFTEEEKTEIKAGIKAGLEGLAGQIPGLLSIQVHTEGLPSSNAGSDAGLPALPGIAASLEGILPYVSGRCGGCGRQGAPEREMPPCA